MNVLSRAADKQNVLEIVDILKQRRRLRPFSALDVLRIFLAIVIPDVPFVEGNEDVVFRSILRLHIVYDAADGVDIPIERHRLRDEVQVIVVVIIPVCVERNIVDRVVALGQNLRLPVRISRHLGVRGTAGNQFQRRVKGLHPAADLIGNPPVFVGGTMVHLPWAIHLVTQAPDPDVMRILATVLAAEIAPVAATRMIAVFEHGEGLGKALRPEVHREHRCRARLPAPSDEFVCPDGIGLRRPPSIVEPHRPLRAGSYSVDPVVVGDEVPARIADERQLQIANKLKDIAAEPLLIGRGMSRLVDAAVDCAAKMFEEGAVDPFVDRADPEVPMNRNPRLHANASPIFVILFLASICSNRNPAVNPEINRPFNRTAVIGDCYGPTAD